jgi:predicted TIM-barrel fold metal-dependent hydrolase
VYERAQALRMPILFHTGYVGGRAGSELYARSHSEYMRPWHLEHVLRRFPDLRIIGAHLGKPHVHEALGLMEKFPNAYCDISGGSAARSWQEDVIRALWPRPGADWEDPDQHAALRYFRKLCFATDNPPVATWFAASEHIMDSLRIPADLREGFYWRNAARVFSLDHLLAEG